MQRLPMLFDDDHRGRRERDRQLADDVFQPVAVREFFDSEDSERQIGDRQHDEQQQQAA